MINFNGADRVTIDGRFSGTGSFLTFRNTTTVTVPTIRPFGFSTIRATTPFVTRSSKVQRRAFRSVLSDSVPARRGNDNNLVTENKIRDLSTATGVSFSPDRLVRQFVTVANSGNVVSNNELFNFTSAGATDRLQWKRKLDILRQHHLSDSRSQHRSAGHRLQQ